MADYQLSGKAEEDLIGIYTFSYQKFGVAKADAYLLALEERFYSLAERPFLGRSIDHTRQGYRQYEHVSHSIFYTVDDYGITVMRVLHNSMNTDRHL